MEIDAQPRTLMLKLGLAHGDAPIRQVWFSEGRVVSVGTGEAATFRFEGEALPPRHELFSLRDGSCLLQLRAGMELKVGVEGAPRGLDWLVQAGYAWRRGRHVYAKLAPGSRGSVRGGSWRVLFKVFEDDGVAPRRIPWAELAGRGEVACPACGRPVRVWMPDSVARCERCRTFVRIDGPDTGNVPVRGVLTVDRPPTGDSGPGDRAGQVAGADSLPDELTTTSIGSPLVGRHPGGASGSLPRLPVPGSPPPVPPRTPSPPSIEAMPTLVDRPPRARPGPPAERVGKVVPFGVGQAPRRARSSHPAVAVAEAEVVPLRREPSKETQVAAPATPPAPPAARAPRRPTAAPAGLTRSLNMLLVALLLIAVLLAGILATMLAGGPEEGVTGTRPAEFAAPRPGRAAPRDPAAALAAPAASAMVAVPAGRYEKYLPGDPQPWQIHVEAFSIDRREVTRGEYRAFILATGRPPPPPAPSLVAPNLEASLPVTGVGVADAAAYCAWAGKRLPLEKEWEKAAAGTDGRTYPWGSRFDETMFASGAGLEPVGRHPPGDSPFGVSDAAGNAAEWVDPGPGRAPFLKGGAAGAWASQDRVGVFERALPSDPGADPGYMGFRCARSAEGTLGPR